MRILHTSDWHIGALLYGQKRYSEHQQFLNWLIQTLKDEKIDALLVAGDIFDTSTPSYQAQALYYDFLFQVSHDTNCRHVVITSGNHDSPTFLDAPKALLKVLNVTVVGAAPQAPSEEVVTLKDGKGEVKALVCAVPFLRDRDLRVSDENESFADKENKLVEGIATHYSRVYEEALSRQKALGGKVPIIGMGHLFLAGSAVYARDGAKNAERDLYVGSLGHVPPGRLPNFDYLALGHLHIPQKVGGNDRIRYSGAPLAMNFDEIDRPKSVYVLDLQAESINVETVPVELACFMQRLQGDWNAIDERLKALVEKNEPWRVEVIYDGKEMISDLRERIAAITQGSKVEVLKIQNTFIYNTMMQHFEKETTLEDLKPADVFESVLADSVHSDEQKTELRALFAEVLQSIENDEPEKP